MKRLPFAVVTLLLAAAPVLAAAGGEVAVVCEQDVAPYRALVAGFTEACDCRVRLIPREEAAQTDLERRLQGSGVSAVLAVGMQARAAVDGFQKLPVLLTMAPQATRWVGAQPNRLGIEMALSPRRHLETMLRVFPKTRRVGLVFDPGYTGEYVREAAKAASDLGVVLVAREIARPGDVARRLGELRGEADVIWLLPDPTVLQPENVNTLLLFSFESHVPLYAFAKKYVELGAIAASHLDPAKLGAQAAGMLPGGSPRNGAAAAARWAYAGGAQLILNQKVARKMGIVLAPDVLEAADDVVR